MFYRSAKKEDAAAIVNLMLMAGGGDAEFLTEGLVPGKTTAELMLPLVGEETGSLSYHNSFVVEDENKIIGLMHACPADDIGKKRNYNIPPERIAHIKPIFELKVPGSYLLLYLSVLSAYRGRGIARKLLEAFTSRAKKMGFEVLSLQVWADNTPAIELYVSSGFKIVAKGNIERHRLLPHDGGILLLSRGIK